MNSKRVSWVFCGMVLLNLAAVYVLTAVSGIYTLGITENLILSELMMILPAAAALLSAGGSKREILAVHRIRISSVLMVLLYTFLMMPLTTLLNAVSMLFVDNAVGVMSDQLLEMPFWLAFLLMAVWGPVCEEFCFRGVIFRGLRENGSLRGAVLLSALMFGLIHMNFNQAPYAFALGTAMALVMEATGSLWAPVLMHVVFNGQSVIQMYAYEAMAPGLLQEELQRGYTAEDMMLVISVYLVIALVATALAACVLVWIAGNEGRRESLAAVWYGNRQADTVRTGELTDSGKKQRLLSLPAVIAIVICFGFMLVTAFFGE